MKHDVTEITRIMYNRTASEYAETHFDSSILKKQYKTFMTLCRGKLVLDVGCGPGRDVEHLMINGYQVIGVDYSDGMIKEAKRRVPKGDFRKMDMRNLRFEKNTFDGIWACGSVIHIPKSEVKNVLKGFNRILKPHGILYIAVKKGTGEKLEDRKDGDKKFFAYYSESEIKRILKENGFKILKVQFHRNKKNDLYINIFAKSVSD
jgi:ubiquinone/menaquinone biosynthesis C-methylase UbiE